MKKSYMKQIKPCFGDKDKFFKIKECVICQFKRKCLLETKGELNDEE